MFLRFTVNEIHEDSGRYLGILHAVRYLRDDNKLTSSQLKISNKVFDWLYKNLEAPDKKTLRKYPTAVSWFREEAKKHIKQMERLAPIVAAHDYKMKRRKCMNPGKIIYADEFQVFALSR